MSIFVVDYEGMRQYRKKFIDRRFTIELFKYTRHDMVNQLKAMNDKAKRMQPLRIMIHMDYEDIKDSTVIQDIVEYLTYSQLNIEPTFVVYDGDARTIDFIKKILPLDINGN